jgi:hypothetical protein
MPLNRAYEEHEVGPDLRRIYGEIRANFDLPFVPTLFKVLAGEPEYMRRMWADLGPVAASKEFHAAANALDEFIRCEALGGGWRFGDQEHMLAEQKIATGDMPVLGGVVGVFARALPRLALFTRLLQRGYSGGQSGHISTGKPYPALSRLISLHVPSEREAGLRVWLIYAEIRRVTGSKHVMSLYRALSPFPGYLASAWMDSKKLLKNGEFGESKDRVQRRAQALTVGLPVRDHRSSLRELSQPQWREIEQTVDSFARLTPQFALVANVWRRSFANVPSRPRAA